MALIQCPTCGAMVSDQAASCPKCGVPLSGGAQQPNQQPTQQPAYQQVAPNQSAYRTTESKDEPSGGLNALSFFVPLVGWILWGVFKSESPVKAASCAKWGWIGFGVAVLLNILLLA